MTLQTYKSVEPVYAIIYRHEEARNRLTKWAQSNKNTHTKIEDNRLMLYEHNALSLFMVSWQHGWDNLLVWDTYLKRHVAV